MEYLHVLPETLVRKAEEFANGAAQATAVLKDGRIFKEILIANSYAVVALRGFSSLPFSIEEVKDIYQSENDRNPEKRDGWKFWDKWQKGNNERQGL